MRSILLVLGISSVTAFQPADRSQLSTAVNKCVGSSDNGDCCYNPTTSTATKNMNGAACPAGSTHLRDWDTSKVTDMNMLFFNKQKFNENIGNWDTSSVTNMKKMFFNAAAFTNKGEPMYWDTSKVEDFSNMFQSSGINVCLCNWEIKDGACGYAMFLNANSMTQSLSCWDTSKFKSENSCSAYFGKSSWESCTVPVLSCSVDEYVSGGACLPCAPGTQNAAGDPIAGDDTSCDDLPACAENQHVVNHVCTDCPAGKTKPAGDLPRTNSECWEPGSCGGVLCVDSNTESCTDNICVCKIGFGGSACDKDITAAGLQKMLKDSRKKALPSRNDLIQRQKAIKDFARDTLKQKLRQGKSVKDAIKETRIPIAPSDLPQRSQMIVQLLNKAPVVAVAPKNKDTEDTCAQGADTAGCSMVDLSDDSDELTILSTDPEPGSWSVLSSGGAITSKQTRVSEFVYEMQCWDNGWGAKQTVDVSDGAQLYACNGNVIMIASQSGICTPTTCNNGNCTIDGSSYTCSCEAGWSGDHCDQVATNSQCYEFDCSNYGGHKTLEHCGGSCSASVCCNYDTKAAFNTVCDGLSSAADYVTNKCCHRDICI
jgi:surface protein